MNFLIVKEGRERFLVVWKVLLGLVLHVISKRQEIEHLVEHGVVFWVLLLCVDFKGAATLPELWDFVID
jgi:hypothetical protein